MIKEIVEDEAILGKPVTRLIMSTDDLMLALKDMEYTAKSWATKEKWCAGLAANQIGYDLPAILIWYGGVYRPMINPVITHAFGGKDWKREGCLSRPGKNPRIQRSKKIRVSFFDASGEFHDGIQFTGVTARVIQHEVDNLNGIFIP